ncbi:MAG: hypothetical protein R3246_16510 [Acidimicrobiia bacterium]|nr:hypothetical protein [Acidimicrobiia bacterium]
MYRSIDRIETDYAQVDAAIARLHGIKVRLIRELDEAQVAMADGARSLTEWVAARSDIDLRSARQMVELARTDQPLDEDMDEGMSVQRAAATNRLRAAGADEETVDRSQGFDLAGVRRMTAAHRSVSRDIEMDVAADEFLRIQPNLDESRWKYWGEANGTNGHLIDKALQAEIDSHPNNPSTTAAQDRAHALTSICAGSLSGTDTPVAPGPVAEVFIDATLAAPTNGEQGVTVVSGPRVGPQVLEEILCSGTVNVVVSGEQLQTVRTTGQTIPAQYPFRHQR